jgi:sterol desaturase/sphingolipid hydroxylase (fatty acid hydroxylase superfamily)
MLPEKYIKIITLVGGRYFITAGIAFVIFYLLLNRVLASKKIQQRYPKTSDYFREIGYSTLTILIFGLVPMIFVQNESISKHTTLYKNINEMGWLYFWSAFPIMIIMHDTYFYWMHRLMHHKKLFKLFHLVHHQSTNPSPWTAYAFHPLEAIVEAGIFIVFLFTIPMHKLHFFAFFMFMIIYNVYGHIGWELYPKNFNKTRIGKWVNTSVAHNQHHQYFKGNYSLYFLFWDRVMGTLRDDYDTQYEKIKTQ